MRYSFGTIRLGTILVVAAVVLLPILFIYLTPPYEEALRSQMKGEATRAVDDVADGQAPREVARDRKVRLRIMRGQRLVTDVDHTHERRFTNRIGTFFVGADEKDAFDSYDDTLEPIAKRNEVLQAQRGGESVGCGETGDKVAIYCWAARQMADGRVVHAQTGALRTVSTLWDTRRQVVALLLQVLGVALVLAWWFGRRTAKPLTKLRDEVRNLAANPESGQRVEERGAAEVVDVARAFNELLNTLEERRAENLAFMADVGHELKGPVTTILAVADKLPADEENGRDARLRRALSSSSGRMKALLDDFLELARAEAGLPDVEMVKVPLGSIVRGVVDRFADDPRSQLVRAEVTVEEVVVVGSEPHLDRVVRNLVDNAMSFAASRVQVRLEASAGAAVLTVEDDGPGVAPEDRAHIFERFYSRREASGDGTGLGLSMSRAIVEAHGGSIRVVEAEGARFVVRLPTSVASVPATKPSE
jgi:two-component system sensor histidine kinase ChvG